MYMCICDHHLNAQAELFQEKIVLTDLYLILADKYFGSFCFLHP